MKFQKKTERTTFLLNKAKTFNLYHKELKKVKKSDSLI